MKQNLNQVFCQLIDFHLIIYNYINLSFLKITLFTYKCCKLVSDPISIGIEPEILLRRKFLNSISVH